MHIGIHLHASPGRATPPLIAMFEDRKRLFVDLLGWQVAVIEGRYEIDAFDTPACTYLIAGDDHAPHLGSLRLLPSTQPHILGSLFAVLAGRGVPTGPDVTEITRLCLPARLGAARRLAVRNALISAMVDHALASGTRMLTGVVSEAFRTQVLAMGWNAESLGSAARIDGAWLGAFAIHIDQNTPALLATTGIYTPASLPLARLPHSIAA
jgi:N-acyl-L-homoserine lactone synthetase